MKLRTCTAALVSLVIGLLGAAAPTPTLAQMYPQLYPQPPIMAPYTPGFNLGVFYVNAGVKFRNLQTVRTKIEPHSVQQLLELGTVPFGPNTEGTILYPYDAAAALPTGNPADPPNVSGIWPYDDGDIDPRDPGDEANDTSFSPPTLALGHYNVPPSSVGSFTVSTPAVQTGRWERSPAGVSLPRQGTRPRSRLPIRFGPRGLNSVIELPATLIAYLGYPDLTTAMCSSEATLFKRNCTGEHSKIPTSSSLPIATRFGWVISARAY